WGSERGVNVSLAWGCAELLYRGSSPDMKKENCGVQRSAMTWGSERGVNVSLAWGCAELLYRGSSPDMKKENCGVQRSAMTESRANKQKL
ncbi:conserved hypothetical protein, partial [Trichinella spiralis]|uniref:hypothetical protein n=1 Tax=Trichinella spiralis TaxID=6334 RepID=UPI0001EFDA76